MFTLAVIWRLDALLRQAGRLDLAPLGAEVAAPILASVSAPTVGAAILRYRLYDLDRIISRVLAYGLLTVLLGGGNAVLVLGSVSSWAKTPA